MAAPRGWIAGPYVWTFNGLSVGITDDGFNLNYSKFADKIRGDNLGDATQDFVERGVDVYADGVFNEWDVAKEGVAGQAKVNANCGSPFWPWSNTFGSSGQIGRLASVMAAALVGTPAPNTSAAAATIKTLTLPYAVLPPVTNLAMLFAARLRSVSLRFQGLPSAAYTDYGNVSWFTLV